MRYLVLATFFLIVSFVSLAQPIKRLKQIEGFSYLDTVINNPTGLKDLPLIVAFHYSSSNPKEAFTDYDSLKVPARIIAPCGNFTKRGGYTYFPPDYYSQDSLMQIISSKKTVDSIAVFLKAISKKYKTKPIVAGFSQGGDISFLLAIYYPELIKAAFPLAGFVHRQRFDDVKKHAHLRSPIHVFQGDDDKIVSADYSKNEVSELSSYFVISITTYPGLGHDFSPVMKRDYAELMEIYLEMK